MGHYRTFRFNVLLKKDTPKEVVNLLTRVIVNEDLGLGDKCVYDWEDVFVPEIKHKFFICRRWFALLTDTNGNKNLFGGKFNRTDKGYYHLNLHTEFKNYTDEIECFLDFISPHVAGRKKKQYVGWEKYEESRQISNIYINR